LQADCVCYPFEAESYEELEKFLKNCHIPLYN
jgi:hypothetical protein